MPKDPFENLLEQERRALEQDLLKGLSPEQYPQRIDWLARRIALDGDYTLRQPSGKLTPLDRSNFGEAIRKPYLDGLSTVTGNTGYRTALDRRYPLGSVVIQYAGLIEGLSRVNRHDIDPGEALGRLVARDLRRNSLGREAGIASDFQAETYTPRGLVEQVLSHPELADTVRTVLPSGDASAELVDQLGEVKLATQLWDHQLMALCEWLDNGANGYVNMATATGKTVLGLAAVAYWVDSGELHPADETELEEWFGSEKRPTPSGERADDVLIVTTDDLLGVQWARLFREHCNTPPEFTEVVDQTISLPWGDIDIRPANAVGETDPEEYRVAIFDEVHNYASSGGWGEQLARYIDSSCPVLALTGSVSEEIERRFRQADEDFPCVYTYTHEEALRDGVIPDFNWTLQYTPIDQDSSSTASRLEESARLIDELVVWDGATYRLDESADVVKSLPAEVKDEATQRHTSPIALGRLLSRGDDSNSIPEKLQTLSSGLSDRRTYWWNLRLSHAPVVELVQGAMDNDKPTLVLTRSYAESDNLYKQLWESCDEVKIQKLEQGEDASTQDERITTFDDWETDRKVLIGPGDRIGTGNDIQSVEVGINLARPGTGMSNSLIQRLGRLLRQPGTKESVDFYHLLGLPSETSIAPMDGTEFIRNSAEFFAQTQTDSGAGRMTKVPNVHVDPTVAPAVRRLEQYGVERLSAQDTTLDAYEQAYIEAIKGARYGEVVIDTQWYADLFEEEITTASPDSLETSHTDTPDDTSTSDDASDSTRSSPPAVFTLLSADGNPVEGTFVVLVSESVHRHGRTNIVGQVGFDIEEPGRYTLASYTESGDVMASSVTIEEIPTEHELRFERTEGSSVE